MGIFWSKAKKVATTEALRVGAGAQAVVIKHVETAVISFFRKVKQVGVFYRLRAVSYLSLKIVECARSRSSSGEERGC